HMINEPPKNLDLLERLFHEQDEVTPPRHAPFQPPPTPPTRVPSRTPSPSPLVSSWHDLSPSK
ncbi:hypothetical protein ACJX0J_042291, partial [Zea mays]